MWDARDVRRVGRRPNLAVWLTVGGLFSLFKKKPDEHPKTVHVEITPPAPPEIPAPKESNIPPLLRDLRFKGLHADVNPSSSVHPAEMTCPSCDRHFRYFQNANGVLSVVHCPGCTRAYRV